MKKSLKVLFLLILIISIALPFGCARREEEQPPTPGPQGQKPEIPAPEDMILSAESWKDEFPLIYESFQRTARFKDGVTEDPVLGGSHPASYLEKYPDIVILYDGIGFGKEYYVARGHYYALEDAINTARPKPGASCLACKTADYEKLYVTQGEGFFAKDFHEMSLLAENSISCYNCHRNTPGKGVQVVSPQFDIGFTKLSNELQEKLKPGTLACAQCHVEYYLHPETKEVILPWDNGIGVDEIESYFDERDYYDWKHPRTGTPLIKVQHPEFEMYTGSIHDRMGITCADCHMPTVEENGQQYKSHWAKSPLKTVNESCGRCHRDTEAIVAQTESIQKEIDQDLGELSTMIVQLIEELGELVARGNLDEATLNELWSLHRKAQYRWDFVFVENSTGFHNAQKSRETIEQGKKFAQQALDRIKELQ